MGLIQSKGFLPVRESMCTANFMANCLLKKAYVTLKKEITQSFVYKFISICSLAQFNTLYTLLVQPNLVWYDYMLMVPIVS